jgi:transposase
MRSRRDHAPEFKAKVALEAAWEELTITEVARKYGLHTNQIRA